MSSLKDEIFYNIETPYLIYSEDVLTDNLLSIQTLSKEFNFKLLYSLKACSLFRIAQTVSNFVDGFSCSSQFEAMLARQLANSNQTVHFVGPGLPDGRNLHELMNCTTHITLNSLEQAQRLVKNTSKCSLGIRVNPELSFFNIEKFDPCSKNSRLGVPVSDIQKNIDKLDALFPQLQGLHFHTNAISTDTTPLFLTVKKLDNLLEPQLKKLKWINLGGGYLFHKACNFEGLKRTMDLLHSKYDIDVYIEPGAGISGSSGSIAASVIDKFKVRDEIHLTLDVSIFHIPAALDSLTELPITGQVSEGEYTYIIGGTSCLAGDTFGKYSFNKNFNIGDRLIFPHTGSYSVVKWHMFNGLPPPSIYFSDTKGQLIPLKQYNYEDFLALQGYNT